jgi:hypothetical protein
MRLRLLPSQAFLNFIYIDHRFKAAYILEYFHAHAHVLKTKIKNRNTNSKGNISKISLKISRTY